MSYGLERTVQDDHADLNLGLGLVAAAPVFAATDIYLVGKGKIELGSKRSIALWTCAFTCGLLGSSIVIGILHDIVDDLAAT